MSQLDSNSAEPDLAPRGVLVQKPKTNIYTVMLIVAFVAMLLGCLFLYLEYAEYSSYKASQFLPAPANGLVVSESMLV